MSDFEQLYKQLNEQQQKAVDTIEGPVLVVAGPGTGKTQLLSMRVANILKHTDSLPQNILCLTFTDSAAVNMRKRLRSIIGLEGDKVAINTFHGLGTEIINANPEYFYRGADFQPADDITKYQIIQSILKDLDYDDPLASYHPQEGWVYAKDLLSRIGDLKKGGLTPLEYKQFLDANYEYIQRINPLFIELFSLNTTKITEADIMEFIVRIELINHEIKSKTRVLKGADTHKVEINGIPSIFPHWGEQFVGSVKRALEEAQNSNKFSQPITAFKNNHYKKDNKNNNNLKDFIDYPKHVSCARVYQRYQDELYNRSLFDFDDMLLEVIEALRKNPELRYMYQEKYQYILVDEFQDTNGAQMTMVQSFIDREITNNRPNILVVGDDDQSIFKFQGANIQNISMFRELFDQVHTITLTSNYRSSQDILDLASVIINNSTQRLAYQEGIDKQLISKLQ